MAGAGGNAGPIGIVIPGYGHPQFLAEAVLSACEQDYDADVKVVVVDDGCRFPETGAVVENLMARFPGRLHYLRQANTRLPGARNAGVRFLLQLMPDLDAVFFLDADNRISPHSLANYRKALGDDARLGWAYPDIGFFGLSWGQDGFDIRETAPDYSRLKHLQGNISEAGSLVRAEVFRQGVFFDETMRHGFEDWDFWLNAIGHGFVGTRVKDAGFLYRRRAESMLADSRRLEKELISKMQRKHAQLFAPRHILALEQEEAPVWALVFTDTGDVVMTSDPMLDGRRMPLADFAALAARYRHARREVFFPEQVMFVTSGQWAALKASPQFLRWFFWRLRKQGSGWQRIVFEPGHDMTLTGVASSADMGGPSLVSVSSDVLLNRLEAGDGITVDEAALPCLKAIVPVDFAAAGDMPAQGRALNDVLKDLCVTRDYVYNPGRRYAGPGTGAVRANLIRDLCGSDEMPPYPCTGTGKRAAIFIAATDLASGRLQSEFCAMARDLKDAGYDLVAGLEHDGNPGSLALNPEAWGEYFSDILPFELAGQSADRGSYLGRPLSGFFTLLARDEAFVMTRTVDAIIVMGASAALEVLGEARKHGVKGYVYMAPAIYAGKALGASALGKLLAYEHAEEAVITEDAGLIAGLVAEGYPGGKFLSRQALLDRLRTA